MTIDKTPQDEEELYVESNRPEQGRRDAKKFKDEQDLRSVLSAVAAITSLIFFVAASVISLHYHDNPVAPVKLIDARWIILDRYVFRLTGIGTCIWAAISCKNSAERLSFPPKSRQATQGLSGSDDGSFRKLVNHVVGRS